MKNILYVNSCVRKESRTNELARYLLQKLDGNVFELNLEKENIEPLSSTTLYERDEILSNSDFSNEKIKYARQFADADTIVISAPFWDLSFPAKLKAYIENVSVIGVTFKYSEDGRPIGLCKANKIYYVSTAGGKFVPDFGYNYIKTLSLQMFGIKNVELIYAEDLDIIGNDVDGIIAKAKQDIDNI